MAGARGALDALDADGWLLAVVTGKSRRGLHDVLEAHGLLSRFVTLKSADDGPGKPDPTLLLDAARESGCGPGRTVMGRSGERRVGKECVSTCKSRWSAGHTKKKKTIYNN